MSIDRAWRDYTDGRPDTVIAYVEGGINWHDRRRCRAGEPGVHQPGRAAPSLCGLAVHHHVRRPGLPPTTSNGDGTFNVADYATDPRVTDRNGNGLHDPEDLIVAFSDGIDHDGNGYVDDISGWDFYDHQNDPATSTPRTRTPTARCKQAAAQAEQRRR